MTAGQRARQVVHLRQEMLREWEDVPVAHAHAAFDRAVSGDRAEAGIVVTALARRRSQQESSGGR
jgi:hypothetical protein